MSELFKKFDEIKKRYPASAEASATMPLFDYIQSQKGFIEESDIDLVVNYLKVPRIIVEENLSWYDMLYTKPKGQFVVKVCRNVSCSLMGAEHIIKYLEKKLGIKEGETSNDKKFTLKTVECLASCGTAPMMMINSTYYENLNETKIDEILAGLK